jgi:hypothetical protein
MRVYLLVQISCVIPTKLLAKGDLVVLVRTHVVPQEKVMKNAAPSLLLNVVVMESVVQTDILATINIRVAMGLRGQLAWHLQW